LVLPISQGSVCPITAWPQARSCNLPRTSLSSCFPLVCTIRWIILDLFSDLFLGGEVVVSASLSVNPGSNIFLNLVTFACFRLGLEFMFKFRTCFSISLKLVGVLGASFSISPLSARIFLFFLCILAGQWWIFLHFLPLLLLHFLQIGPSGVRALPLANGINVGGHYKWPFFPLLSLLPGSLLNLPEGVVIGIQIFAWAPK
jgi:hypothetical protein